jgi:hypothetical protein
MKRCPQKSITVELMEKDGFGPNSPTVLYVRKKEKLLERRFITNAILPEGKADLSQILLLPNPKELRELENCF